MKWEHPVFGPDRMRAARAARMAERNAIAAYSAYGWHSDDDRNSVRLKERLSDAMTNRAMYAEYGNSVLDC